tara:strand:- start:48 stop:659 length:612 start_codon:yes stop_codon:yes gene_type:complete
MFTKKPDQRSQIDPIVETIAKSTRNMTKEESEALSKKTTEEELAKLAKHVAEKGLPDNSSESGLSDEINFSESEIDSDSDYKVPTKRQRPTKKPKYNDISEKLYDDNQKLWEKIQILSKKFEKTENEYRYLKLDYNNELVKINKLNDNINSSKIFIKNIKSDLFYNKIHTYILDFYFIFSVIYTLYTNINYFTNYFNALIFGF